MEDVDIYNEINSHEEEDNEIENEDIENESNEIEEKVEEDEEEFEQEISNINSNNDIDESKVINNNNKTRWMFGIWDRGNYDIHIFYLNNNRTRDTLLPLILNHVYIYPTTIINNRDEDNTIFPATRVFSDYFSSYQESDFNSKGFILHKVNYWVGFGQSSFHTNSIEGV